MDSKITFRSVSVSVCLSVCHALVRDLTLHGCKISTSGLRGHVGRMYTPSRFFGFLKNRSLTIFIDRLSIIGKNKVLHLDIKSAYCYVIGYGASESVKKFRPSPLVIEIIDRLIGNLEFSHGHNSAKVRPILLKIGVRGFSGTGNRMITSVVIDIIEVSRYRYRLIIHYREKSIVEF